MGALVHGTDLCQSVKPAITMMFFFFVNTSLTVTVNQDGAVGKYLSQHSTAMAWILAISRAAVMKRTW